MKMLPPVTQKLSPINSYMLRFVTSKALVMTQFFLKFRIKFNVQLYADLKIYRNNFKVTNACCVVLVTRHLRQGTRSFAKFKKFFHNEFTGTVRVKQTI